MFALVRLWYITLHQKWPHVNMIPPHLQIVAPEREFCMLGNGTLCDVLCPRYMDAHFSLEQATVHASTDRWAAKILRSLRFVPYKSDEKMLTTYKCDNWLQRRHHVAHQTFSFLDGSLEEENVFCSSFLEFQTVQYSAEGFTPKFRVAVSDDQSGMWATVSGWW